MEGPDKTIFKRIFEDHWDAFRAAHPLFDTPWHNQTVGKMLDCGNPDKMGFVQYRCPSCGEIRRIAFTCKSCFCLSCSKGYTDRWADFVGRRLLPGVAYRHVVFTMPDFLALWFYRNPALLEPLIRTGHACLKDIFKKHSGQDLDLGSIVVLQTAGRSGHYNPHLHILVTGGGINPQGQWTALSYIPFSLFHRKWQYHLLTMLRQNVRDPAIRKDLNRAWKDYPNGFVAFLEKGDVPPGGKGLARYLAKYVVSPPISVRRIEEYDGQTVRYWYRDHKSGAIQHEALPVLRFIGRMVQHILPKGFQRIRYFGLHSNVRYRKMREHLAAIVPAGVPDDPRGYRILPRTPFAQLFFKSFGRDPLLCPRCGTMLERELVHHPAYGTILDEWDQLFVEEITLERSAGTGRPAGMAEGKTLGWSDRMVQVSLPFL